MKACLAAFLAVSLVSAGSVHAQVWAEIPDAPALPSPGQDTVGVGPLTTIVGFLTPGDPADMFCIRVVDPIAFGAAVTAAAFDTQLFMFDLGGLGMNHNDDNIGFLSGIYSLGPAVGAVPPVPLVAGGVYGLAISGYDSDPANVTGAEIWADGPFGDQTGPDGFGGALAGWVGTAGTTSTYEITLIGATYCSVPTPGSLAVLAGAGLVGLRRRRR